MNETIWYSLLLYSGCGGMLIFGLGLMRRVSARFRRRMPTENWWERLKSKLYNGAFMRRRRGEQVDKEIYEAISFLRNMITSGEYGISGDYAIEQLAQKEGVLQNVYVKMLGLLRLNQQEEAAKLFANEAPTVMGKELAGLLLQWDRLEPTELMEILLSHQKNIKETWITRQKRRDETISDLIYLPVVINVFVIFMNFIYVGYFIQQQELLQMFM